MNGAVLLAVPLGLAIGALLGLLGAGGSVLTVPALVYLLDQPVAAATTAALAIVAANAAAGAALSARDRHLDWRLAFEFGAAAVLGALLGSYLSRLVAGETVLFLLAIVMCAAAWALWRGRPEAPGRARDGASAGRLALILGLGAGVGVLTGFFGVGGGFVIVPVLVLLLGVPVRIAIGTSLLIIAIASVAALIGHLSAGGLSLPLTLSFAIAGTAGSLIGVRLSARVPTTALSRGFAGMLVLVAAGLLVANVGAVLG